MNLKMFLLAFALFALPLTLALPTNSTKLAPPRIFKLPVLVFSTLSNILKAIAVTVAGPKEDDKITDGGLGQALYADYSRCGKRGKQPTCRVLGLSECNSA